MALDDRQHVEAVSIMRRMYEARMAGVDGEAWDAAGIWLEENHPAPTVYMAALAATASTKEQGPA